MFPLRFFLACLLGIAAPALWAVPDGAAIYAEYCAVCHGEHGDGQSRAARALKPPPRDFTHADPRILTRERMLDAVTHGRPGTAMQPFASRLSLAEREAVVDYIRANFMSGRPPAVGRQEQDHETRQTSEGERLYRRHCAVCHGDDGAVAVWARNSLKPPPRDFSRSDPRRLTRERMLDAVTHGRPGTAMQPFASRLSLAEREAVVDYIRQAFLGRGQREKAGQDRWSVPPAEEDGYPGGLRGDPLRGEAIFQGQCYVCHGREGKGNGPRASFIRPPPRDFTSPDSRARFPRRADLFRAIAKGKKGTVMPAWGKVLSPQEIADVAEYVYRRFVHPDPVAGGGAVRDEAKDQGTADARDLSRGRRLYDRHCYFCHGYDGDARTLAAAYLRPPPVDFTRADPARLTPDYIITVLREGRPGTAMQSFKRILDEAGMADVAIYVHRRFVVERRPGGNYHTPENGWPDHDRYRDAYPFVLGEMSLEQPVDRLTPAQRRGRALYLRACITCHDQVRSASQESVSWAARPLSYPRGGYDHRAPDQVSGASPFALHDRAPSLDGLSEQERQGERLYQDNCAFCHARDGSGANWIGAFLEPHPRDLRDPELAGLSDEELAARISRGVPGSAMPAWGRVLSEDQILSVVAYLRRAFFP